MHVILSWTFYGINEITLAKLKGFPVKLTGISVNLTKIFVKLLEVSVTLHMAAIYIIIYVWRLSCGWAQPYLIFG